PGCAPQPSYPLFISYPCTPPTSITPLSLHDALPIFTNDGFSGEGFLPRNELAQRVRPPTRDVQQRLVVRGGDFTLRERHPRPARSEEHTSELQSRENLVCRLLLEKKKGEGGSMSGV